MVLPICQAGEIILRRAARPLTRDEILSPGIRELVDSMFETMRAAPGVGLAAPQIGRDLQLAVIEDPEHAIENLPATQRAERLREVVPPHVIINPRLILRTPPETEFFEGCLSLTGFTAIVPRSLEVQVECLNENAEPVTIHARGWYARILQHEIDHLNGTLYIDRMLSQTFMGQENFQRYWKDQPIATARRLLLHV
jgi:peptide deformylase